jgi:hypothetical protein
MNLKKCPVSEFTNIFIECGLETELNAIPQKMRTAKLLSRPLVKLFQGGVEDARKALRQIVDGGESLTNKRKAEEACELETTDINEKHIKKLIRTFKCSKMAAIQYLRKYGSIDTAMFNVGLQLHEVGFIEDVV